MCKKYTTKKETEYRHFVQYFRQEIYIANWKIDLTDTKYHYIIH